MEKFILIPGLSNYAVSNYGNVINVKTKKVLSQFVTKTGYLTVSVSNKGVRKTLKIHRLVALSFLENPYNKPQVNHIDGNKQNNHLSNLEWCTAKENDKHARENKLKEQNKPILATHIESNEKINFYSIGEASSVLGINKGSIHKVLSKKRNKTNGYHFSYISN